MADLIQIGPGETDLGKIVAALRAVIERFPASEDAAEAATPTTTQIISGAGLTGGGDLSADRTLAVGAGTGITVNADDVALANMAQNTIKGRVTASTGAPEDLTASQGRQVLGLSYGLQTIWVPAAGMVGYPGATPGQTTYTSGGFSAITYDFDQMALEAVNFQIAMPKSWDKGSLLFVPYWTATGGSGAVFWSLFAAGISDNEVLNAAISASVNSTDTFQTADRLHIGPISGSLTPDLSPANDDMIYFALTRDPTNVADTLTADARLIGAKLLYTVSAGNDT